MNTAAIERVLDAVWANQSDKRYIPRGYDGPGHGWGVWDQRADRYVEDSELARIDASEPMARN